MLAVLAPGQGAQKPGMLTPWLRIDGVRDRLRRWSAAAGLDLEYYGTSASAAEIIDTAVAQPLLTAAALLAADLLGDLTGSALVAGHSVGELSAASLAGVLGRSEAVQLARIRGLAMADAAGRGETGMSVVVGGIREQVLDRIAAAGAAVANVNGARQVVAAGTKAQLARLAADPQLDAHVVALTVAGAFHTEHMRPATAVVQAAITELTFHDPDRLVLSNTDGTVMARGAEVAQRLVTQITGTVRWDLCMQTMRDIGATTVVELLPGGTLTGLIKRELPSVELLPIRTPDDLGSVTRQLQRSSQIAT